MNNPLLITIFVYCQDDFVCKFTSSIIPSETHVIKTINKDGDIDKYYVNSAPEWEIQQEEPCINLHVTKFS